MSVVLDTTDTACHFTFGNDSASSGNHAFSTGGTNRIVLVAINVTDDVPKTVSSVTLGGVSLSKFYSIATAGPGEDPNQDLEIWWGFFASQQTAQSLVVTLSGTCNVCSVLTWAVSGQSNNTSPWDTSSSLPATNSNLSASGAQVSVSGVSTAEAHTMLFQVGGADTSTGTGMPVANGTGWSEIFSQIGFQNAWDNACYCYVQYQSFSSKQAAFTASFDSTSCVWWNSVVFGITSDIAGPGSWSMNLCGV